jgi:hypothetical protein
MMPKTCPQCGSKELTEVAAELTIRRQEGTPLYMSGKVTICSDCGFAQYLIPERALGQLREG